MTLLRPLPKRTKTKRYAHQKTRLVAFIIDHFLLCLLAGIIISVFFTHQALLVSQSAANGAWPALRAAIVLLAKHPLLTISIFLTYWLYHAYSESSSWQATPGKYALGIKVTGTKGQKISFLQASLRHITKLLLLAPVCAGFWYCYFNKNKQMLHDRFSGSFVLQF